MKRGTGSPRLVLVTDLDNTLVGHESYLRRLQRMLSGLDGVVLVYSTGRCLEDALELIAREKLAAPDFLVTDVGCRIFSGPRLLPDRAWEKELSRFWDPPAVDAAARGIPGLHPQSVATPLRKGYMLFEDPEGPVRALREQLRRTCPGVKVIVSSGRDVDVIPAGGGKGPALRYLAGREGWPPARVLVAGDSGNDVDMLLAGFRAVVVANAQPELLGREWPEQVYLASLPCAGGIMEALAIFFPALIRGAVPRGPAEAAGSM